MNFRLWLERGTFGGGRPTMRIKIVDNPVVTGGDSNAHSYRQLMQSVAGQYLDVDTQHLFGDQFNVNNRICV
jgi:hypothetical protein